MHTCSESIGIYDNCQSLFVHVLAEAKIGEVGIAVFVVTVSGVVMAVW